MKPCQGPFRYSIWRVDGGCISGFNEVLGDHIDHTFVGIYEVAESILGVIETTGEANDEDRGVVVDHLSVTERSKIGGLPCHDESRSD